MGWSIDMVQDANLVVNALDMAIKNRRSDPGGTVQTDPGAQISSSAFTNRIRSSGWMTSSGTIGDGLDNAMMKSFWISVQVEMLNRKKWRTRIELANDRFEYIEIFFNRQRCHPRFGYRATIKYELTCENQSVPA